MSSYDNDPVDVNVAEAVYWWFALTFFVPFYFHGANIGICDTYDRALAFFGRTSESRTLSVQTGLSVFFSLLLLLTANFHDGLWNWDAKIPMALGHFMIRVFNSL